MAKLRVMIVDDHEVVRIGLKSLLSHYERFEVVGEAGNAKEALDQALRLHPDIVLMDIRLPGTSGIEACEQIITADNNIKVIMLTSYAEDEMLFSAIRAGASGYVLKQIGSEDLVKAIESVGKGEALLDPAVTQRVFQEVRTGGKRGRSLRLCQLESAGTACAVTWYPKGKPTGRSPRSFSLERAQFEITSAVSSLNLV